MKNSFKLFSLIFFISIASVSCQGNKECTEHCKKECCTKEDTSKCKPDCEKPCCKKEEKTCKADCEKPCCKTKDSEKKDSTTNVNPDHVCTESCTTDPDACPHHSK